MSYWTKIVVGLIGTALACVFVLGLAQSIATGFAGFLGGLPFIVIAVGVLSLAVYDFYEECILAKRWDHHRGE